MKSLLHDEPGILWRIAYSGIQCHHLRMLDKKSWLVVPIYDEDKIETFQQFTAFNHHVKCPTVHGGLGLRHRCPVTTAYLCHPHSSFF